MMRRCHDGRTPQETRDYYDNWAQDYEQHARELKYNNRGGPVTLVECAGKHLPANKDAKILDVGAGIFNFTIFLMSI